MRARALRREQSVLPATALTFVLGLAAVDLLWPRAFVVSIAIGGALGAFTVLYEVRTAKRLAQAEFLRDLQTSFAENSNIQALWAKLLLGEEVRASDRPQVSAYLTFFETLHLLVDRGNLEFGLIDDLFRNRFFKAVGDPGVLRTALARDAGSFTNVHDLIGTWHDYLVSHNKTIHPGYYSYIEHMLEARDYEVRVLTENDLGDLEQLQKRVLSDLEPRNWLRANDQDMLRTCLVDPAHRIIGAFFEEELVAAAALFDAGRSAENVLHHLVDDQALLSQTINLKLVMVSPGKHRRCGLGRTLVELAEQAAGARAKREIACTIHRDNQPSRDLFRMLGYRKAGSVTTSYGPRDVFARRLPSPRRQWAR